MTLGKVTWGMLVAEAGVILSAPFSPYLMEITCGLMKHFARSILVNQSLCLIHAECDKTTKILNIIARTR